MVSRGKSKRRRENNVRAGASGASGPLPPAPATKDVFAIPPGLRRIMEFSAAAASKKISSLPPTQSTAGNVDVTSSAKINGSFLRRNGQNGSRPSSEGEEGQGVGEGSPVNRVIPVKGATEGSDSQVQGRGGNVEGGAEGGAEETVRNKKRKVMKVGDWRVEAMQGGVLRGGGERKKPINSKKKDFLNSKKSRKKLQLADADWESHVIRGTEPGADNKTAPAPAPAPPSDYFGAVVQAPPKLSVRPKVGGQELSKKAPGVGTVLARHFSGALGLQAARKEKLRQEAVEQYRLKKEGEKKRR